MLMRNFPSPKSKPITREPLSKRFSLVKVKADENFNRRNTWSISRIKIFIQRRDRPKWDVLKLAQG
ncbi:MAG: hypothetical protein KJ882_03360, partial [Proteobacteria bacterium]|nr:hypothetical protein [Pseudomonadota bacterium]